MVTQVKIAPKNERIARITRGPLAARPPYTRARAQGQNNSGSRHGEICRSRAARKARKSTGADRHRAPPRKRIFAENSIRFFVEKSAL
jgi:hypothetical protein